MCHASSIWSTWSIKKMKQLYCINIRFRGIKLYLWKLLMGSLPLQWWCQPFLMEWHSELFNRKTFQVDFIILFLWNIHCSTWMSYKFILCQWIILCTFMPWNSYTVIKCSLNLECKKIVSTTCQVSIHLSYTV